MTLYPVTDEYTPTMAAAIKLRCSQCQHLYRADELMFNPTARPGQSYWCEECTTAAIHDHNQAAIDAATDQEG